MRELWPDVPGQAQGRGGEIRDDVLDSLPLYQGEQGEPWSMRPESGLTHG